MVGDQQKEMKKREAEPESPPQLTTPEVPRSTNPLRGYLAALESLEASREKLATLKETRETLAAQISRFELERERLLDVAVAGGQVAEDGQVAELARLQGRLEIARRRLADTDARLAQTETDQQNECEAILGGFHSLWILFKNWVFAQEKARVEQTLVPGIDQLSLEKVALYSKAHDAVRVMEITSTEPSEVLAGCARLLEAVASAPQFVAPPYTSPAARAAQIAAKQEEQLFGPYADLPGGLTQRELHQPWNQIREQFPELDMAGATKKLQEAHPEVFLNREGVLALQQPKSLKEDNEKADARWRASMIGDTRLPEGARQVFVP